MEVDGGTAPRIVLVKGTSAAELRRENVRKIFEKGT